MSDSYTPMLALLRFLRLLCVVVWVGGLVFFAFVLAPVAFHLLPSAHAAGIVVGGTLRVLHIIGLFCGVIFGLATAALLRQTGTSRRRRYGAEIILACIMLLATAYIQVSIIPAMEQDRLSAGGAIEIASTASPARLHFDLLHKLSERVEGGVLFCGLGIVLLMAFEPAPAKAVDSLRI